MEDGNDEVGFDGTLSGYADIDLGDGKDRFQAIDPSTSSASIIRVDGEGGFDKWHSENMSLMNVDMDGFEDIDA